MGRSGPKGGRQRRFKNDEKVELDLDAPEPAEDVLPSHVSLWSKEQQLAHADYIGLQESLALPRIVEGTKLVIDYSRGKLFGVAGKTKTVRMKNHRVVTEGFIGKKFGTKFVEKNGHFVLDESKPAVTVEEPKEHEKPHFQPKNNNSELFDSNGESQALKPEQVLELKRKGITGRKLAEIVASNSTTFAGKTEFSQEKYLKKKAKKHDKSVTVLAPTFWSACEILFEKDPKKTLFLRPDTLAHMLTAGNVRPHHNTMVFDSASGLVTGAVAFRQGGMGHVLSAYNAHKPSMECLRHLDVSAKSREAIVEFPIQILSWLLDPSYDPTQPPPTFPRATSSATGTTAPSADAASTGGDKEQAGQGGDKEGGVKRGRDGSAKKGNAKKKERTPEEEAMYAAKREAAILKRAEDRKIVRAACLKGVDSLIICSKYEPLVVLRALFPLLAPGGVFVVHSSSLEPLAACMDSLKKHGAVVNPQISEQWYRESQVLPNRTHPHMNMTSSSGYLLTGIKLAK